jgi:hypothetical protein
LRPFKKLPLLLGILTILSASSCGQRPKFDPNAYRANHRIEAIVNEHEHVVYAYEPLFSEFACMHRAKWEELRRLVQILRIDPQQKEILIKALDFVSEEEK